MKPKHRVRYWLFLILVSISVYFCLTKTLDFLSYSHSVKSDILVVEGWLSDNALQEAKTEFLRNHYQYIITTGFPDYNGYLMGYNGKMEFDFSNQVPASSDSNYTVTLLVRGTRDEEEYPHFRICADSIELGENFATSRLLSFQYQVKLDKPPSAIQVHFDNDHYSTFRDRNLYVYSVKINTITLSVNNETVTYYYTKNGEYYFFERLRHSRAISAAKILINAGLPDSLVIPVETIYKVKSKTYTTALDVKKWMNKNDNNKRHSITIFTQGCHARRSYVSYKKVFGSSADIGVICVPDKEISRSNWFLSTKGWTAVLYETIGLIYISVFIGQ